MSPDEAKTMCTRLGRSWRNSSIKKVLPDWASGVTQELLYAMQKAVRECGRLAPLL